MSKEPSTDTTADVLGIAKLSGLGSAKAAEGSIASRKPIMINAPNFFTIYPSTDKLLA